MYESKYGTDSFDEMDPRNDPRSQDQQDPSIYYRQPFSRLGLLPGMNESAKQF